MSRMSSSDSPITPIRVPDGTVVPSGTRILRSVPDANASRSITALSVSISASTSPLSTRSPSAFRHFTTTPSSIESVSLGMITRLAMRLCPVQHLMRRGHHRSEEHTSELQSLAYLVCRLLLEKKKNLTPLHISAQT